MNMQAKRSLSVVVTISAVLSSATAVVHATPRPHTDAAYVTGVRQLSRTDSVGDAINRLDPYVEYGENEIRLNAPRAVIKTIDPEIFNHLNAGLQGMNQQIKEGKVSVAAIKDSRFQSRDAGENSITAHWWGYNIKLSNDVFNRISKVGYGIAGVTGIMAAMVAEGIITIPASIPIGTIAAVIAGAVALLQPCNWNDRGVQLRYMFIGPSHCWPQ